MPPVKKQSYIDLILSELRKGNIIYKDVIKVFNSIFKCSEATFVTYWKEAQEIRHKELEAINNQKSKEYTDKEIEAHRSNLLSREKVVEMAQNVLKMSYNKAAKETTPANIQAFNKSLETFTKLQGLNMPDKHINEIKASEKDAPMVIIGSWDTIQNTIEKLNDNTE